MEDGDITLVTKIHNQDIEINTLWDQLLKFIDINNVLIDFIQRNELLEQLKREITTKIREAIIDGDEEKCNLYTRVFEKIKKQNN